MKKQAYFAGHPNYDELLPFNDFHYPGQDIDNESFSDTKFENRQRDGKEFDEFDEFRKTNKDRIKKLKRRKILLQMLKDQKPTQTILQPHPFYSDMYGGAGIEGTNETPLEYYSGSLADGPNEYFNPWNNIYQTTNASKIQNRISVLQNILVRNKIA